MPDSLNLTSHVKRWITGILLGLPVILCIAYGPPWSWWFLVTIAGEIGLWELYGLLFPSPVSWKWRLCYFAGGLLLPSGAYLSGITGLNFALFISFFAALFVMMISSPLDREEIGRIGHLCFAWMYLPYFISFILLIGVGQDGRSWIFFLLAVIIAGDTAAYYVGSRAGRYKLYQAVSPKKTIEGSVGGLFSSIIAGTVIGLIFLRDMPLARLFFFSLMTAAVGQIGDLIESMIKRNAGKKDSSGLLPGHGGLLDRLDAFIFVFPLLWCLLQLTGSGK